MSNRGTLGEAWDGKHERRINHTDHDTLIQLVQIMKGQTENANMIASNLKIHEAKDEENFKEIKKDILGLQRIVWTATGIIVALDAMPKIAEIFHLFK